MKKIITTVMLAVAAICSTAQAGDFYLGGAVGFMHKSGNEKSTNEFTLMPELGYSFNDKWGVGGTIGYTYLNTNYKATSLSDTNLNLFTINPYVRFTYFRTSNDLIALFIDGSVGFGIGSTTYEDLNKTKTAVTYEVGFKPGIAINITDHFSIVSHLGFLGYHGANDNAKDGGQEEYGGVNFDSNHLDIGLYYTF